MLALVLLAASPGRAQTPDTTGAPPPPPNPASLTGFSTPAPGTMLGDSVLARRPEMDVTGVLVHWPASFEYELGATGWPDGWSPYALHPHRVALTLDGRPFDDLVTGRPRYDLLPFSFLTPLYLEPTHLGRPYAVHAYVRDYDRAQPYTELRYRTSNDGMQSIMAMHVQRRRRPLAGRPGAVQFLFGYGGHAARNEYPGSRLRRARQLLARIRYAQSGWSLELANLHNRRQVGAHGGVQPLPGEPFASIYNRLSAQVEHPDARRQTIRNDLGVTLRADLSARLDEPLVTSLYWTAETFRYRNPGVDTLTASADRYGARFVQAASLGPHRLRLTVDAWTDGLRHGGAVPDTPGRSREQLHAALRDTVHLGATTVMAEVGIGMHDGRTHPTGHVSLEQAVGPVRLFAEAWQASSPVSRVEASGFGASIRPAAAPPTGRTTYGRFGVTARGGPFDATVFGYSHRTTNWLDLSATARSDSAVALMAPDAVEWVGFAADVGIRREAERGLYLTVQPSTFALRNALTSAMHRKLRDSLPQLFLHGRLGLRETLFQRDLVLDLYVQARFWTAMRSRTLHPPTGLLTLPESEARVFGPSSAIDVVAEAGIRGATVFVGYDNVLSGTALLPGNLLVPVYPLPAQRFRFGVFWPIPN